jgi:hypothetical protein
VKHLTKQEESEILDIQVVQLRRQIYQLKEQKTVMVSAIRKRQSLYATTEDDAKGGAKAIDFSASMAGLRAQKIFEHRQKAKDVWDDPCLVVTLDSESKENIVVKHSGREVYDSHDVYYIMETV